jgi:hypothetical protein
MKFPQYQRAAILLLILLPGCGQGTGAGWGTGAGEDLFFPTYEDGEEHAAAPLEAKLSVPDSCLFGDGVGEFATYLLLWPEGWSARTQDGSVVVMDGSGDEVVAEGERAVFIGGETSLQMAEEVFGVEVPAGCRSHGVWIVAEVTDRI